MTIPNPWTFLKAVGRFLLALIRHEPVIVPEDVEQERLNECHWCDSYDPEADQCEDCSCPVMAKVMLSTEFCPRKKWKKWTGKVDKTASQN